MNQFEQLIEYVINDEEQKARELFHNIVVDKSRQIYENLMVEENDEEEVEGVDESAIGGDAADDLIDDVEMDEESDINMEDDSEEEEVDADVDAIDADADAIDVDADIDADIDADVDAAPATKDDILNLEDKLDELMAEFEQLMGGDDLGGDDLGGDDLGPDEGGDAIEMDDTDEMMPMAEAITLKAAPKPTTSEEGGVNKKSTVAANSGAAGMAGKPVKADTTDEKGRKAPDAKDMISDFQNKAGAGMKGQKAAPKPVTSQASGTNTRTPFPKG